MEQFNFFDSLHADNKFTLNIGIFNTSWISKEDNENLPICLTFTFLLLGSVIGMVHGFGPLNIVESTHMYLLAFELMIQGKLLKENKK